jgi:hypothetical protein
MITKRKKLSKFDVPPARGSYDWILKDIHDEIEKVTPPPPPPEPPKEPPRPPRVHVDIEIVDRRYAAPPARKPGGALKWLVAFGLIAAAIVGTAHGETWTSHKEGFMTRYQSDQGASGSSYKQGFMTYYDMNLPDGSTRHCHSYKQGWQTIMECDP